MSFRVERERAFSEFRDRGMFHGTVTWTRTTLAGFGVPRPPCGHRKTRRNVAGTTRPWLHGAAPLRPRMPRWLWPSSFALGCALARGKGLEPLQARFKAAPPTLGNPVKANRRRESNPHTWTWRVPFTPR